jgi:nucleotide-binding universal stress UspA family protein
MKAELIRARPRVRPTTRELFQIKNILVPTDFSPASMEAVKFARSLGKIFRADLHLLHVLEPPHPIAGMLAMPLFIPDLAVRRRVRRHLRDLAERNSLAVAPENIHLSQGAAFEEICRLAGEEEIDLVVISTRGHTGLKHLALGSTAERVVRYSSRPVLVVHRNDSAGANGRTAPSIAGLRKILVPIDFSQCSLQGLAYAKSLAKRFESKLVLLHSLALQSYITSDEYGRYDLPLLEVVDESLLEVQRVGIEELQTHRNVGSVIRNPLVGAIRGERSPVIRSAEVGCEAI